MKQLPLPISIDSFSTFSHYYSGSQNALVLSVLSEWEKSDDNFFIYLWGEKGSGVTHLIESVQQTFTELTIQYLPLKKLQGYPIAELFDGLETMDMVCIDDVETILGDKESELPLFHLFNRLQASQKKLLIGGHVSPLQAEIKLADLQSRLNSGLTLNIIPLTEEQKVMALSQRAEAFGLELSDEVIKFLLLHVDRSTGNLFRILQQLNAETLSEKRKLTIPFVKKVLNV